MKYGFEFFWDIRWFNSWWFEDLLVIIGVYKFLFFSREDWLLILGIWEKEFEFWKSCVGELRWGNEKGFYGIVLEMVWKGIMRIGWEGLIFIKGFEMYFSGCFGRREIKGWICFCFW